MSNNQINSQVSVREETVLIPTYEIGAYNKNPMFLEKRVYQGSSGRVYPHPVCESISDEKHDKAYKAVFLENDYILVMILPELGGRIQRLYDKTNGYDAVYYNEVVKPALVGLAGPWISGGIEFNWPQHHRPSTFDPIHHAITNNPDGSVTVTVGETEKMFHTKGNASFTVYPDKAYLEIKGRIYNPTEEPQTFLWWANPAVAVNDHTFSVFPPDVNAVFDHGKRDVSSFPIAKGVYYKVNYAPGTDISRYKNIPVPTSYMAHHSDYDFIGNYDESVNAGLLHVADHHISPGKKQWTWGNGDFGCAWDRNLTDENGPYIELMTGVFTDNQPDFTFLKPFEEKTFTQYFMPYKGCGAIKNATADIAVNMENRSKNTVITVYSSSAFGSALRLEVCESGTGKTVFTTEFHIAPTQVREFTVPGFDAEKEGASLKISSDGKDILTYTVKTTDTPIPSPAKPMKEPAEVDTCEELFLCGTHLEQYRHATYRPEDYYLEGLRRDPSDIRLNNAYGKLIYRKGRFEESIGYFRAAVKKATTFNPNPYDCEPYFNLGLAYKRTGDIDKAYDAFYKAVWDGNIADRAFYELACISAMRREFGTALTQCDEALLRGSDNMRARTLKIALLRLLGQTAESIRFAEVTLAIDPLDPGALYEFSLLKTGNGYSSSGSLYINSEKEGMNASCSTADTTAHTSSGTAPDTGDCIVLSDYYAAAGLVEDAANILKLAPARTPMVLYRLYSLTGDISMLKAAESADPLYCFPNDINDIPVLRKAVLADGRMAAYYLGCLLYDKGEWEDAVRLWESIAESVHFPTVHRNLALAYFNKMNDSGRALNAIKRAFAMDETDARVFFEYDQLLKVTDAEPSERLALMEKHHELLETRDDLYTEYISLLNATGSFNKAYELMMAHKFHPWEGGEGKITAEYRKSLIAKADAAIRDSKATIDDRKAAARDYLLSALNYPENLGEGKLIGALDNDLYLLLAEYTDDPVKKHEYLELAARGDAEFTSAVYYNDRPPEMVYFSALAMIGLGRTDKARAIGEGMVSYGNEHINDNPKIDYFAVSLPDFLVFNCDLKKKNTRHCENMIKLGNDILSRLD